jgi:leucyl aminopeptidase
MLHLSTARAPATSLRLLIAGRVPGAVPAAVAAAAKAVGTPEGPNRDAVLADGRRFAICALESKPWLVGGEDWRILGQHLVEAVRSAKATSATVEADLSATEAQALAEGMLLADYRYIAWRSGAPAKRPTITVHLPGQSAAVAAAVRIAGAQNLARDLADTPPNVLHPTAFAQRARAALRGSGVDVRVLSGVRALTKAGFPGLVQVGKAGSTPPCLVEMRWRPRTRRGGSGKHLALVGKGITFDTGGISLKPGDKMWEMKGDMGGAAAVLGAMTAIAAQRPAFAVTGYLCLAENMPDSTAQRPGDIYRARNGTTIHVDNTDAEGRLVLADVLTYACEQGATHVVDVATLTGACMIALGEKIAGLLGRPEHQAWIDQVRAAGQAVGEELWQLPLHGEYRAQIDHPHADVNNTGGRMGGTITAALFLAEFVPASVPWVHLDIAGPAIQPGGWRYYAKGMTGFATRTLIRLAAQLR